MALPAPRPALAPLRSGRRWLAAALIVLCAYAAFARGGVGLPRETCLQLAVAALAAIVAGWWLGARSLRPAADPLAVTGVVLLVGFAAWTGASLLWSVAPDDTWASFNRALTYGLLAAVALVVGSVVPLAVSRIAAGWLVVAVGVALYALAGKVLPGIVHHANDVARLRAPLEYWNALGLVCVLGAACALRFVTATGVRERWRVCSLIALFLLLSVLGMTYSRGGVIALAVVVLVLLVTGERRMEGLIAFVLGVLGAVPVLVLAYTANGLADNAAPHDDQVRAGLALLAVVVAVAVVLAVLGAWLVRREDRVRFGPRSWGVVGLVVVALLAGGVTALAVSERGLGGSLSHLRDDFTEVRRDRIFEPDRLLSTSSGNRWAWWREAGGAFADEPVLGWGAGSFAVSRRLYRVSPYDVRQPHSLPMQALAETGLVGALLLLAALACLLVAGGRRLRRRDVVVAAHAAPTLPLGTPAPQVPSPAAQATHRSARSPSIASARRRASRSARAPRPPGAPITQTLLTTRVPLDVERHLAGALFAAAVAWLVHACIDWDWDIPGVTVPVVVFLGVLGARRAVPRPAALTVEDDGRALSFAALAATVVVLLAFVASSVLPAWSDAKADDAYEAAATRSEASLRDAAADADLAARLDPLAVRPLFAAAAVAEGRGRLLEARDDSARGRRPPAVEPRGVAAPDRPRRPARRSRRRAHRVPACAGARPDEPRARHVDPPGPGRPRAARGLGHRNRHPAHRARRVGPGTAGEPGVRDGRCRPGQPATDARRRRSSGRDEHVQQREREQGDAGQPDEDEQDAHRPLARCPRCSRCGRRPVPLHRGCRGRRRRARLGGLQRHRLAARPRELVEPFLERRPRRRLRGRARLERLRRLGTALDLAPQLHDLAVAALELVTQRLAGRLERLDVGTRRVERCAQLGDLALARRQLLAQRLRRRRALGELGAQLGDLALPGLARLAQRRLEHQCVFFFFRARVYVARLQRIASCWRYPSGFSHNRQLQSVGSQQHPPSAPILRRFAPPPPPVFLFVIYFLARLILLNTLLAGGGATYGLSRVDQRADRPDREASLLEFRDHQTVSQFVTELTGRIRQPCRRASECGCRETPTTLPTPPIDHLAPLCATVLHFPPHGTPQWRVC